MQVDLIQCTVRLNQKGNIGLSTIVKSGPSALRATEVPLLRMAHDTEGFDAGACCISEALVVGKVETTRAHELELLSQRYGRNLLDVAYPGGRGLPLTIADLELPDEAVAAVPKVKAPTPKEIAERKAKLREALTKAAVVIPPGNLSEEDLMGLAEEAGVVLEAA